MSKYIPGNRKHLSLDDRKYIEKSLNQGLSFKETAKYLCKDPATISKEVRFMYAIKIETIIRVKTLPPSPKKSGPTVLVTGFIKALSITPITFVSTVTAAGRPMYAVRSSSVM